MSHDNLFEYPGTLDLEAGGRLERPAIAYRVWGQPRADGTNVVWVCHALTANADVLDWWAGLFGEGALFDPSAWCIVCANMPGSCYGSTGPLSADPRTGRPWFGDFPALTIRDQVQAFRLLAAHLGLGRIGLLIGGSMGGQQALEWAVQDPERFDHLALLATNAVHSPWGVAFNESQRMAIAADPTWGEPHPGAGLRGLEAARSIALLSYRNYRTYQDHQSETRTRIWPERPASYQRHQGRKLSARFNAYSYWTLSRAMDSHDLGRGRGEPAEVLRRIPCPTLVISMEGDLLFPEAEQRILADHIPGARHRLCRTRYGHDGFLVEVRALAGLLDEFLSGRRSFHPTPTFIANS